ncbi:hypothetical protein D3C80_2230090 [compost metagenome]
MVMSATVMMPAVGVVIVLMAVRLLRITHRVVSALTGCAALSAPGVNGRVKFLRSSTGGVSPPIR